MFTRSGQPPELHVHSEQDAALVSQQKSWRWLPFRAARPSEQSWSPLQCLPAVSDLIRLRRAKALRNSDRATLGAKPACQRLKLHAVEVPCSREQAYSPQEQITVLPAVEVKESADAAAPVSLDGSEEKQACNSLDGSEEVQAGSEGEEEVASPQDLETATMTCEVADAHEESDETLAHVVLDVGFASVELKKLQTWPKYEFYIAAKDGFLTRDGAVALLDYLDFVLHLPEVISTGFVLTYDLRSCACPQLDLVSWIMHFISDPQREQAWHERCVCWKVVVPAGMYFSMAESVLSLLFKVCPPKCRVFLVTDIDTTKAEQYICYRPEDLAADDPSMLFTIGSGLYDTFFPAHQQERQTYVRTSFPACPPAVQEPLPSEDNDEVVEGEKGGECADSLTTPFAVLSQRFDPETSSGHLTIMGRDAPMTDEGIEQIMQFMDDFVNSANAQQGFSITYDLRSFSVPSMGTVNKVSEWGRDPDRQRKWGKLNTSCKVVVSQGFRFSMCKGVLKSFFYVCPPVCRTLLLTHPDEPEETALIFEPVDPSGKRTEEDCQTDEPEADAPSDDGGSSSCGHSADTSDTTSASACSGSVGEEPPQAQSKQQESKDPHPDEVKMESDKWIFDLY